jgi:predicted transcriptional regulator
MTKVFVDNDEIFRHTARMKRNPVRPTRFELSILRVLWDQGPLSVRDIQGALSKSKPAGYTTVLKMVQIMTEKGLVDRDETVRPQLYRASLSQDQTQRGLLDDLIERAYGGSVRSLVLHALSTRKTSQQDLQAIEELLNRAEERRK